MKADNTLTIRTATEEDIPLIRNMAATVWPATYGEILSSAQLQYMLQLIYSETALQKQMRDGHRFLIVEDEGKAVAFADYSRLRDTVYKLNKIYVLQQQQGKGTGKFLIETVLDEVKNLNASSLWLNVNRNNKARQFYERLGFEVISEEDIDIGEGYFMNDYIMEKTL